MAQQDRKHQNVEAIIEAFQNRIVLLTHGFCTLHVQDARIYRFNSLYYIHEWPVNLSMPPQEVLHRFTRDCTWMPMNGRTQPHSSGRLLYPETGGPKSEG